MNIYDSLEMLLSHHGVEIKMETFSDGWIDITITDYGDVIGKKTIKPESSIKNIFPKLVKQVLESKRWS